MQDAGWCVVMSKPAAEEIAERSIREAGYRVYLPCYRKILRGSRFGEDGRRIRSRRDEVVSRPLFPLYLFVELCPHQQWSPICRSTGVTRVLGVDTVGRPALLAPELVHLIRETERCGEFDEAREDTGVRTDLSPGDAVRVPEMNNLAATLTRLADHGRAHVVGEVLGRAVSFDVQAKTLVLAVSR